MNLATGGTANDSAGNAANARSAFDQNSATQWLYGGVTGWLQYDLGRTERVQRYTVTSANDRVPRDPKDWQFQGSTDGSTQSNLNEKQASRF
ncbi:discoidin domain-containing protein [Collimonas fungivorans]|uniref:discoidin domain-containing protein n=1 Tax=Collimonas fungivorans TaxID=158899 RepID=UPI003FA3549D